MELDNSQTISIVMYWITIIAVASSASAGVLEAGKKNFDLFGIIIVAVAAAIGGGTIRDLLLDRTVFWVRDQTFLLAAIIAAVVVFFVLRRVPISQKMFLIPDAVGLSMFAIAGTNTAWLLGSPWLVASFMGVITGVMGGILRDVLCNEEPLVFQGTLYATAAWGGSLLYIYLRSATVDITIAAVTASLAILLIRLLAIRWQIGLPKMRGQE